MSTPFEIAQLVCDNYIPLEEGNAYVYAFKGICSMSETFNEQGIQDDYVIGYHPDDSGLICYVGEGRGNRINRDTDRKFAPPKAYRYILRQGISQDDAYILEGILVSRFGRLSNLTGCLANLDDGGKGSTNQYQTEARKLKVLEHMPLMTKAKEHTYQRVIACTLDKKLIASGTVTEVAGTLSLTNQQIYACLSKGSHGTILPSSGEQVCFCYEDAFHSFVPRSMRNSIRPGIRDRLIAVFKDNVEVARGTSAELVKKLQLPPNGVLHRLARGDVALCYGYTAKYI